MFAQTARGFNAASVSFRATPRAFRQVLKVRQHHSHAQASRQADTQAPAPQLESSNGSPREQTDPATQQPQVECVATGMDVACFVPGSTQPHEAQQPVHQQQPSLANAASNGKGHIDCVATGMDVQCFITDDEDGTPLGSVTAESPVTEEPASAVKAPKTAAAAASGQEGPLMQLLGVALLVSPFFFWGTSMVAMKPVTAHTTPLLLGAMRLLPAGLALVAWAAATGRPQPQTAAAWAWVAAFAVVDGAAFQGFLAEGLQHTTAGLGSVIIDSQPLSVALLAALLFGEALSPLGITGLLLGVAGLLLLELPQDVLQQSGAALQAAGPSAAVAALQQGLSGAVAGGSSSGGGGWSLASSGEFWMLLAAQSMAVGTVMVRWVSKHCDPVAATAWHMVLGGLMLAGAAVVADGGSGELSSRLSQFNSSDALAMAYVSLFGGAASYGIFFYEATHGSLTAISSLTFLTPVFAAGAGYLLLGETLTPLQLLGATVTLSAVFAINTPASHTNSSSSSQKDASAP